jgi:uncharacterized membrane protein
VKVNGRDRGATLPIVALILPVLIIMTAFAVDLGRQRSSRRTMQARADIVALDLVRLADGRSEHAILNGAATDPIFVGTGGYAQYLAASALRNDVTVDKLVVDWGTWNEASGFVTCGTPPGTPPPQSATTCFPNAVEVTASETTDYFFQPGSGDVSRTAVATYGDAIAGFSIGSFGASLDAANAGLLNSLLTPLLGSPVGLNALSYQGLAVADVGIGELGSELGLLTADEVLNTDVAYEEWMLAAATVLERNGDFANAEVIRDAFDTEPPYNAVLTSQIENTPAFSLADMISAEEGADAALESNISVLDLLAGQAFLSQCTDPADLATCSGLNIPSLGANAGIVNLGSSIKVIQGKIQHWGAVGTGTIPGTNQTQIDLAARLTTNLPCASSLTCLVNGLAGGVLKLTVEVRPQIKLAEAIGTIDRIDCSDESALELDVGTQTGLYNLTQVITIKAEGLVSGLLGTTTLRQGSNAADSFDTASFTVAPDVYGVTVFQTGSGDIGLRGLSSLPAQPGDNTALLGTIGSLAGLTTAQLLTNVVNPLLTSLDVDVVGPLTDLIGVNVVGSDVTPLGISCDGSGLKLVG